MGLSNELSCEAGSFSHCFNPHRFFQLEVLRLYFPMLETWVVWSDSLSSCCPSLSACKCGTTSSVSCHLAHSGPPAAALPARLGPLAATLLPVLSAWLPVSSPPTGLYECFFFYYPIVRLSYSSIFCQFWLFFVFKFFVVLLLVVTGGAVCLPTPPAWLEVCFLALCLQSCPGPKP